MTTSLMKQIIFLVVDFFFLSQIFY